jgi:hypothetical protein
MTHLTLHNTSAPAPCPGEAPCSPLLSTWLCPPTCKRMTHRFMNGLPDACIRFPFGAGSGFICPAKTPRWMKAAQLQCEQRVASGMGSATLYMTGQPLSSCYTSDSDSYFTDSSSYDSSGPSDSDFDSDESDGIDDQSESDRCDWAVNGSGALSDDDSADVAPTQAEVQRSEASFSSYLTHSSTSSPAGPLQPAPPRLASFSGFFTFPQVATDGPASSPARIGAGPTRKSLQKSAAVGVIAAMSWQSSRLAPGMPPASPPSRVQFGKQPVWARSHQVQVPLVQLPPHLQLERSTSSSPAPPQPLAPKLATAIAAERVTTRCHLGASSLTSATSRMWMP